MHEYEIQRWGAHLVVDALVRRNVDTFFMNPGTSEVHLVSAIDQHPEAKPVLCLFEGGATGAADGFARASGRPAAVLLHLGPGLANGLANLHNARKARSPMIVVVGEHAREHLSFDTPLNSDLPSLARYAAKKVFDLRLTSEIASTVDEAVSEAITAPAGPVVIVANVDVMWSPAMKASEADPPCIESDASTASMDQIGALAEAVRKGSSTALIIGGTGLSSKGVELADRIGRATGCKVFCETFNAAHDRGAGRPYLERLPYFREHAVPKLAAFDTVVLLGSRPPVAFFASPDEPSPLTRPDTDILALDERTSTIGALAALAGAVEATAAARAEPRVRVDPISGRLNAKAIWAAMNRQLPQDAIISDESGVTSIGADEAMRNAASHTWMNITGGSIGQAIPVATGAALARRNAVVVAMQGDGGAMYTIQSLWTQAREQLHVVNVILRNDRYAILDHEVKRHGIPPMSPKGARMFDLTEPAIDWAALAGSLGVKAMVAETAEEFESCLSGALAVGRPVLIEARLNAKERA
ncbi:acetolactate synthase large subunit [Bordetella sp. BOR01]|uniref:acetolactate synthase large subunit n=1 Tax=Bordetella sp. BOR01 TaxID=2854779 RepID=UPI001C481F9B|nr:acetolactate synthase large subunit [Bordetella sp. BOR01]MBV7483289.1 acetolactate synthase large subunit [Bordetella sp. BOR01]